MSPAQMADLHQAAQLDSTLMDYCQPTPEDFLQGGLPGHLSGRHTPGFRSLKTFPSLGARTQFTSVSLGEQPEAGPAPTNAIEERYLNVHERVHDHHSFSYSDGSAKKTGGGQQADGCGRFESDGTLTGTGLIMARTHQERRIDPNGKDTSKTINRAELVGAL